MFQIIVFETRPTAGHVNISRAREFYIEYTSSFCDSSNPCDLISIAKCINFLLNYRQIESLKKQRLVDILQNFTLYICEIFKLRETSKVLTTRHCEKQLNDIKLMILTFVKTLTIVYFIGSKWSIRSQSSVITVLGSETKGKSPLTWLKYSPPNMKVCFEMRIGKIQSSKKYYIIMYDVIPGKSVFLTVLPFSDIALKNFTYSALYCVVSQNNQKINKYNKTIYNKILFFDDFNHSFLIAIYLCIL
ncbi:hypothetical protein E24_00223 [Faustovirus]|nr:putative structural protein p72 [Faustovirus]AMN83151.1 hypothetical protein E24_00223 [Faustovirus]AMN84131.1 hypothetical protein D5a_00221 [Faustovirus]AMN85120.1 hypothetical protein E23_00222 [Faustovirus]